MSDGADKVRFKGYAWVGPRLMSDNGLEMRSVVTEYSDGTFNAGTRFGPKGSTAPEFGPEELFTTTEFKSKDQAMFAARADTAEALKECNEFNRQSVAEKLLERASGKAARRNTAKRIPSIRLVIDR